MITVTTKTKIEVEAQPLCVKELAAALGREMGRNTHPSFVYAMRGAGFKMRWHATLRCEVATVAEAKAWLERTGFRKA